MFSSRFSVIPGFWLSLGYTLSWLSLIVLLPLAALFLYASHIHFNDLITILGNRQLQSALKLSLYTSFFAALIASILGAFLAWMLARHSFIGKKIIDSMVDLPLALPTAIAGIALTTLYAPNGLIGSFLPFKVAYTPLGIITAMVFVTIPFTIRTLEPLIKDIPHAVEEAAKTLGATPLQTFLYIIFPMLFPAWLTGFSLAMARSLGEYGSVVFIAANIPYKTEILPILIVSKLDQFDYTGATVISLLMLLISFALLFAINLIQRWIKPHRLIWFITHLSLPGFGKKTSS